jgi:hypothetical protein
MNTFMKSWSLKGRNKLVDSGVVRYNFGEVCCVSVMCRKQDLNGNYLECSCEYGDELQSSIILVIY